MHAHVVHESITSTILTPPHEERTASPRYRHTHEQLVNVLDKPCAWCGVRKSTLGDKAANRVGATQIETHHFPIEWSMADACDWRKVHERFPEVISQQTFEDWIDSPGNILVLCDRCHRSDIGIHHLSASDAAVRPFLLDGYVLKAPTDQADLAKDLAEDDALSTAPQPTGT